MEFKLGKYQVTVRWKWVLIGVLLLFFGWMLWVQGYSGIGLSLIAAGVLFIFGPGMDIEPIDSLEGTIEDYGHKELGELNESQP